MCGYVLYMGGGWALYWRLMCFILVVYAVHWLLKGQFALHGRLGLSQRMLSQELVIGVVECSDQSP